MSPATPFRSDSNGHFPKQEEWEMVVFAKAQKVECVSIVFDCCTKTTWWTQATLFYRLSLQMLCRVKSPQPLYSQNKRLVQALNPYTFDLPNYRHSHKVITVPRLGRQLYSIFQPKEIQWNSPLLF